MSAPGLQRPLRVLVVDDEAPARARLRRLLDERSHDDPRQEIGEVDVVAEAASGDEAVTKILELVPDLVLLDIQMPGRDGFGVIEAVGPEAMPLVAFATAYDEHALRAFEVHALDYLLKPVRPDRLASVLRRARRAVQAGSANPLAANEVAMGAGASDGSASPPGASDEPLAARLAGLLATLQRPGGYLRRILVHHAERALLVPVAQIIRVSAERNTVRLFTATAQYTVRAAVGTLEARLDPDAFLRINRSDIVRLDAIKEMHPWSHGDYHVVLTDGTRLVWSRRFKAKTEDRFGV